MTDACSWCSTPYAEGVTNCSSCGANLAPEGDANLPGLTSVDAASIIRSKSAAQPRSRLMSWLSGEYASDVPSQAEAHAYAPPDQKVRREILRLEMEAEMAHLKAEADAQWAEAAAEGRELELATASASEVAAEGDAGAADGGEAGAVAGAVAAGGAAAGETGGKTQATAPQDEPGTVATDPSPGEDDPGAAEDEPTT